MDMDSFGLIRGFANTVHSCWGWGNVVLVS